MNRNLPPSREYRAYPIEELLKRMAKIYYRHRDGFQIQPPQARICLYSGAVYEGYVVDYRDHTALIVELKSTKMVFVRDDRIESVNMDEDMKGCENLHELLSPQKPLPVVENITKLEFRRRIARIGESLAELLGREFTMSVDEPLHGREKSYHFILGLCNEFYDAVKTVIADEMGKSALKKVESALVREGTPALMRDEQQIIIFNDFLPKNRWEKGYLRQLLEEQI